MSFWLGGKVDVLWKLKLSRQNGVSGERKIVIIHIYAEITQQNHIWGECGQMAEKRLEVDWGSDGGSWSREFTHKELDWAESRCGDWQDFPLLTMRYRETSTTWSTELTDENRWSSIYEWMWGSTIYDDLYNVWRDEDLQFVKIYSL